MTERIRRFAIAGRVNWLLAVVDKVRGACCPLISLGLLSLDGSGAQVPQNGVGCGREVR